MTRMSKIFLLILLIMVGMGACKKDAPIPPILGACAPRKQFLVSSFAKDRFQYASPYFNPLNSNEFVYQFIDYESLSFQLRKFNIETKDNELLMDDIKVIYQPKWSRSGWIATDNYFDHQIWIVKDSGDSLKKVTNITFNFFPVWNNMGTSIHFVHAPNYGIPNFYLKTSINGSHSTDTILWPSGPFQGRASCGDISPKNDLVAGTFIESSYTIGVGHLENLNLDKVVDMYETFNVDNPTGLCWNYDGTKIFISIYNNGTDRISGLFEVDIYSGQITKRMDYCFDQQYSKISASPNGDYLIGERIDSYYRLNENGEPNGVIVENSSIYLIDLLTMEETRISLE